MHEPLNALHAELPVRERVQVASGDVCAKRVGLDGSEEVQRIAVCGHGARNKEAAAGEAVGGQRLQVHQAALPRAPHSAQAPDAQQGNQP